MFFSNIARVVLRIGKNVTHNGNSICEKSLLFIKDSKKINSSYNLLKMVVSCLRLCLSNWKRLHYIIFCYTDANINVSVNFFMVDLIISLEMGHSYKIITGKWNQLYCIDKVYCLFMKSFEKADMNFCRRKHTMVTKVLMIYNTPSRSGWISKILFYVYINKILYMLVILRLKEKVWNY